MAQSPSKKVTININEYYVTYESNSESPSAGQILSVEKNSVILNPTSSEALTVINGSTTQTTLKNSLKHVNFDLYNALFGG